MEKVEYSFGSRVKKCSPTIRKNCGKFKIVVAGIDFFCPFSSFGKCLTSLFKGAGCLNSKTVWHWTLNPLLQVYQGSCQENACIPSALSTSQPTKAHNALKESLLNAENVKSDIVNPEFRISDAVSLPAVQTANANTQVFTQVWFHQVDTTNMALWLNLKSPELCWCCV